MEEMNKVIDIKNFSYQDNKIIQHLNNLLDLIKVSIIICRNLFELIYKFVLLNHYCICMVIGKQKIKIFLRILIAATYLIQTPDDFIKCLISLGTNNTYTNYTYKKKEIKRPLSKILDMFILNVRRVHPLGSRVKATNMLSLRRNPSDMYLCQKI